MSFKNNIIVNIIIRYIKSKPKISKCFYFSDKQRKYKLKEYLIEILYILKTGIAWRDTRSFIKWESIYKTYNKLNFLGIFKLSYIDLLNKYIKRSPNKKLKYILTDTSFIPNKKGKDVIGYSKFYNRKNGTKISIITDSHGIPLNINCYPGNDHDSKILIDQLKNWSAVKYNNISKNRGLFLADPAYDCKKIRDEIKKMNYDPLICQNKRNIKDKSKIIKFNDHEKIIYKKRLIVEHTFNKLKMNKRLMIRYDSKIESFEGFIYLALVKMIC